MADGTDPRLTVAEGRRFAFTVAGGFAVLAGVAYLRSRGTTSLVLLTLAGSLVVAGVLLPTHLGPARRTWMALGVALSRITAPVFYGVMYWLVITPIGVIRRSVGRSPLARDPRAPSYWFERPSVDDASARRRMERQF